MDKRVVTTLIVAFVVCLFNLFFLYEAIFVNSSGANLVEVIAVSIFLIAIIFGTMYFAKKRIDEIRGGEEDDLSKYWLYYRQGIRNVRYS